MEKSDLSQKDKEKWKEVMTADYMSSEFSCSEDDQLITKKLEWRSSKASKFFQLLDEHYENSKSSLAKRQSKKRCVSNMPSDRSVPSGNPPNWVIRTSFLGSASTS